MGFHGNTVATGKGKGMHTGELLPTRTTRHGSSLLSLTAVLLAWTSLGLRVRSKLCSIIRGDPHPALCTCGPCCLCPTAGFSAFARTSLSVCHPAAWLAWPALSCYLRQQSDITLFCPTLLLPSLASSLALSHPMDFLQSRFVSCRPLSTPSVSCFSLADRSSSSFTSQLANS